MFRTMLGVLGGLFLSLALTGPSQAQKNAAPASTVSDEAHLFSADAESRANAIIARIKSQHKKDLLIETRETVKRPDNVDPKNPEAVKKFFDKWAIDQFKNHRIDGIYVGIVKNPTILRVEVGPRTL